ncbi:MAG: tetratricopeptide repeat protein, partial [Gemmatimonadota bacterium]
MKSRLRERRSPIRRAAGRAAPAAAALVGAVLLLAGSAMLPDARAAAQAASGARAEESRTLALAIQLERSGQPMEAERVLIELLGSQPTAAQALAMLARLTEARGEPDVALPYAEEAAEQASYEQAAIHQTYIRALAASGLGDRALEEARAWIRARPSDVTGYAELSTTFETLGRHEDAVQTLLDARERTGDGDAFSQELAVLHERAGRHDAAAEEWARVLAWGDAGVTSVEAHLRTPGVPRDTVLDALETTLTGPSVGVSVLRGALQLALQLDRGDWARALAEQIVVRAPREMRWQVLRRYYARARDAFPVDARWAASRLAADAESDADRLQ